MAQQARGLAAKPDNLPLTLGIHMAEEEIQLPQDAP